MPSKKIKIRVYTYTARRVFIYASPILRKLLHFFTLEKRDFNFYSKTVINVADVVDSVKFKEDIDLKIRPWFLWFLLPLTKGAFKTPVIIVNHKVFSSGSVPDKRKLQDHLTYVHEKNKFLHH